MIDYLGSVSFTTEVTEGFEDAEKKDAAFDAVSEDMFQAQQDETAAAMTEGYIESWDEPLWIQWSISWTRMLSPSASL